MLAGSHEQTRRTRRDHATVLLGGGPEYQCARWSKADMIKTSTRNGPVPIQMPPSTETRCARCAKAFRDDVRLSFHLGKSPACQHFYDQTSTENTNFPGSAPSPIDDQDLIHDLPGFAFPTRSPSPNISEGDLAPKRPRVTVEDVEDESEELERDLYPGNVAEVKGEGMTMFDDMLEEQRSMKESVWSPFADRDEWELANWLMKNATQTAIDDFLKLNIVSVELLVSFHIDDKSQTRMRTKPSFRNKVAFLKKVDSLPIGPKWVCDVVSVAGNKVDANGQKMCEEVELWRRDPVECVQELLGNPQFAEAMSYAPERRFRRKIREYGEMNSADWWWTVQVSSSSRALQGGFV